MIPDTRHMRCELCGRKDPSVAKRLVACRDGCEQGVEMIACGKCADESYEEAGYDR